MKIGMLTFHWADDFGAMLQAYGLKCALKEMGFIPEIVPYSNINLSGRYWLFKWVGRRSKPRFVWDNIDRPSSKNNLKKIVFFIKKHRLMKSFRNHYLTHQCWCSSKLLLNTQKYDGVVIGSDQVWNPEITVGIDNMYMGQFPKKKNAKVVSYAASIGKEKLDFADGIEIGKLLDRNFDAVSVREKSSIDFLKKYCSVDIVDMPDPTLLCTREEWNGIMRDYGIESPFVIVYCTENNKELSIFAQNLCDSHGLRLINCRELAIGPSEFLWLIDHAEYVVTNSFHCAVFSIIFHKQFFVFNHSSKNARLKDLLENTGLDDRISDFFSLESLLPEPGWDEVDDKLKMLKNRGFGFLERSLMGDNE